MTSPLRPALVSALAVAFAVAAGCKKDGPGDAAADGGNGGCGAGSYACAAGCCDCPGAGVATAIALLAAGAGADLSAGGDFDGDGRLDLVLAVNAAGGGGVASFLAVGCGGFVPGATALAGATLTGLDAAALDGAGAPADVVAFAGDRTLYALDGDGLATRWSDTLSALGSAGLALAAHLDATDTDDDVIAFDATLGSLLRVENTGAGWNVRTMVLLPPGIVKVSVGDVGGGPRDEIFFAGPGGLVEVVSVADFDFSDVRVLNAGAHGAAAVGDLDGDGDGDLAVVADGMLERWNGDGNTGVTYVEATGLPGSFAGIDVVALEYDGAPPAEAAVLQSGGSVVVLSAAGGTLVSTAQADTAASARRVFAGDVDGDARDDLVVVDATGTAWVWRTP
ncbi:MAG TPA: hypothetical protein VG389_08870 [Myxococcota bacterium]|jgi:hypothetical protein|nr:hypothetical protein [Myxococcota bacterium]